MAYKVFSNGDALTGSELNTYLMNQSVMVFASTTARDAALTAPTEGMLVWLQDSDKYVKYTGSAWADLITPASSGNAIINGAFEINQRNFTSTTSAGYGFDRWKTGGAGGTQTYSSQTFTPGAAPVSGYEAANFARVVISGQSAVSDYGFFGQNVEGVRNFAGQTVTLSFWAKAATGTPKIAWELVQDFGTGGSPSAAVQTYAGQATLSTSWARYSITLAVPSISGKTLGTASDMLQVNLWLSAGSNFNARTGSLGIQNNTFDIWGVQLEAGSVATPFKRNAPSIQAELAACQRYYWEQNATSYKRWFGGGFAGSTTQAQFIFQFPVTMRTAPTVSYSGTPVLFDGVNLINTTGTNEGGSTQWAGYMGFTATGLTQYRPYHLLSSNSGASAMTFTAEL